MFMLTPAQGLGLAIGWGALTTSLLLGVFLFLPRSRRLVAAEVTCPVLGGTLGAQVVRDEWTRKFCQVERCDALGGYAPVTCNQRCLRTAVVVVPVARS